MWGSLIDTGKHFAEKAKKAAENIDQQLNESLGGVVAGSLPENGSLSISVAPSIGVLPPHPEDFEEVFEEDAAAYRSNDVSQDLSKDKDIDEMETDDLEHELSEHLEGVNANSTDYCGIQVVAMTLDDDLLPQKDELFDDNKNVCEGQTENLGQPSVEVVDTKERKQPDDEERHLNEGFDGVAAVIPDNDSLSIIDSYSKEERLLHPVVIDDLKQDFVGEPGPSSDLEDHTKTTNLHGISSNEMKKKMEELTQVIQQQEEQIVSKNKQLVEAESHFQKERSELMQKVQSTKDEAKRRISKAKERVELLEKDLVILGSAKTGMHQNISEKDEIIVALRTEGEKLARKQAEMEKVVRLAKSEAREMRENLEQNIQAKDGGLMRIRELEDDLIKTRESLSIAQKGESQAEKLESELSQVRGDNELRQVTIMSLDQQVKELKSQLKDLTAELNKAKQGAVLESEHARKKLVSEQNDLVAELELTIRSTEREAAVREDALRRELEEIRKRWQDAVRRADSLSIDIQSSTAPLLRQIDSVNKQNRLRASVWAELENQLRSELDDNVALNEKLSNERNDWKTQFNRIERLCKEKEVELNHIKQSLEEKSAVCDKLQIQIEKMDEESSKMKADWAEIERLANEGVSRVRTEMTKTVIESEERYRVRIDDILLDLNKERENRSQLEQQVEGLLNNVGLFMQQKEPIHDFSNEETKPKQLRQTEGQATILAHTLSGLVYESDDENDDVQLNHVLSSNGGSFAALDQLTTSLKSTKNELNLLRKRLEESETSRETLLADLSECRNARDKLALFEAKVKELNEKNYELSQEVRGLREDIVDVRELYRTQLNLLLEEKASSNDNKVDNDQLKVTEVSI